VEWGRVADWFAPDGALVRRYLTLLGAGYHRTAASVRHKQDPAEAARARRTLAGLKKRPRRAG
jgi:hypothetical protein